MRGFHSAAKPQAFIKLQCSARMILMCFKVIYPLWMFGVNGWGRWRASALKPLQRGCGWGACRGAQVCAHFACVIIFLNTEGLEIIVPVEDFPWLNGRQ